MTIDHRNVSAIALLCLSITEVLHLFGCFTFVFCSIVGGGVNDSMISDGQGKASDVNKPCC